MNKLLSLIFIFFVIALSLSTVNSTSDEKSSFGDQFLALDKLFKKIGIKQEDYFELNDNSKDNKFDYCKNNGIVKCNETDVTELKLQTSYISGNNLYTSIQSSDFRNLTLDKLELTFFDLDNYFIFSAPTKKLVLDLCKGFKISDASKSDQEKLKGKDLLDITIDESYWKKDIKREIKQINFGFLANLKFAYTGKVDESLVINFDMEDVGDLINEKKKNWEIMTTDFPNIDEESKFDTLNIKLLNVLNLNYSNIEKYEKVNNLILKSIPSASELTLDSELLFKSLNNIEKEGPTYFGTDMLLSEAKNRSISLNNSEIIEITILNALDFVYKKQFPISSFPPNLQILKFTNWNGGALNFSKIENTDNLNTINMKHSLLKTSFKDLNIPSQVQNLDLTDCHLYGSIGDDICERSNAEFVDNYLMGKLPTCYSCYPTFKSKFDKNSMIGDPTGSCNYKDIYNSLKLDFDKELGQITVTGDNIGFTTEEFNNKTINFQNINWKVVTANKKFIGTRDNGTILKESDYTTVQFNQNIYDIVFSWNYLDATSADIKQDGKTRITFHGHHFPLENKNITVSIGDKKCSITNSTYLNLSIECPEIKGTPKFNISRTYQVYNEVVNTIDLSRKGVYSVIFCNGCASNQTCNYDKGVCQDVKKDDGSGKKDKSEEFIDESGDTSTANFVVVLVILALALGGAYFGYNKFIAQNKGSSTRSSNDSSYRSLNRMRDDEEEEDGIQMKSVEDQE